MSDDRSDSFFADPNNSVGYLCRIAFRSFSRALEMRIQPHGVSSGQWRFLRVLWSEDGITQRELSRRVGLREPTTVTAVKSLERNGLVRREPSLEDRRRIHVFLTPRASALEATLRPYIREVNALATLGMTEGQIVMLRELLIQVGKNLAKEGEAVLSRESPV